MTIAFEGTAAVVVHTTRETLCDSLMTHWNVCYRMDRLHYIGHLTMNTRMLLKFY